MQDKLITFLSLHKNSELSSKQVRAKVLNAQPDDFAKHRAKLFLAIYFACYEKYAEHLNDQRMYDFADMINDATRIVSEDRTNQFKYRYILVDEVQDLSRNRFHLVRELLRRNADCKLFAVGDDWQSIYRFTGSDLTLIQDFEQYFQLKTRQSLIETTHRFGNPTIKTSTSFIQQNPLQKIKNVRGDAGKTTPINIILNAPEDKNDDSNSITKILRQLIAEQGYDKIKAKELQIISRYNHDLRRIKDDVNFRIRDSAIFWRNPESATQILKLEFCSMHKSKGITRDIVIALNMNDDLMGMPSQRETDPIIDSMLARPEPFVFAEERRLFYVAITRAREATYLIANYQNPSPFLYEISSDLRDTRNELCPKCESGELKLKHGPRGDFYYCSNLRYGCDYLRKV